MTDKRAVSYALAALIAAALAAAPIRVVETERLVAAPAVRGDVPAIFVPEPKNADDTLDNSPDVADPKRLDMVTTLHGDRVNCQVIDIGADGVLRFTAPQFEGETRIVASQLDRVALRPTKREEGGDEVALTNGDRLVGRIVSITPDAVVVESEAMGMQKVARRVVRAISFAGGQSTLIDDNFSTGRMEPWKPHQGSWSVKDGALIYRGSGSSRYICAPLEQKEAVTMTATVERLDGQSVYCYLILFSENDANNWSRNCLYARFRSSDFRVYVYRNGSSNRIISTGYGRSITKGTVRMAYDPDTGKAKLWLDSALLGEYSVPNKPTSGNYVLFGSQYSVKVTDLKVLRGIVPPSGADSEGEEETDLIRFVQKDRLSASSVAMAGDAVTLATAHGKLNVPRERIEQIVFRTKGQETPKRQKGDVRVHTAQSRLTVQFDKLDADHVIGRSDYLGDVKVLRSAVRSVQFNIYR